MKCFMKTNLKKFPLTPRIVIFALTCFAVLPVGLAVVPPPDGGYPNFTTAEGTNALLNLTSGAANTGIGWYSLSSAGASSFNTGVGAGALALNAADSNTAIGAAAMFLNTTGIENTAVGTGALLYNDAAINNTATGAFALSNHVSGNANTANGWHALFSDTAGQLNTAIGAAALASDDNGFNGSFNTAVGGAALFSNNGGDNTAVGAMALQSNSTANANTAVGLSALASNTTGNSNVALGHFAGIQQTNGSNNVYIGADVSGVAGESDACYIASIFGQTSASGVPVLINSNNKLGTMTSSKRYKENIQSMGTTSEAIFALKPVTFKYKRQIDPKGIPNFGLVAEEVEEVDPDLIVRDEEGKAYSVRYEQINAMLLNEFLKEHHKVEEQGATIMRQRKDFEVALAQQQQQIKELAASLQKVSAKLELKEPAPQTVLNQ